MFITGKHWRISVHYWQTVADFFVTLCWTLLLQKLAVEILTVH
jgi:hypothetical protein